MNIGAEELILYIHSTVTWNLRALYRTPSGYRREVRREFETIRSARSLFLILFLPSPPHSSHSISISNLCVYMRRDRHFMLLNTYGI